MSLGEIPKMRNISRQFSMHFEEDDAGNESIFILLFCWKDGKLLFEPEKRITGKKFDPLQGRFDAEKKELSRLVAP